MERLYYTPREVAQALGISDDKVLQMVNSGEMPGLRVSPRITRVPIAAFDLWREGFVPRRRAVTIGPAKRRVVVGEDESLPTARRMVAG
jgi:excisionase family DNA binding protein